MAALSHQELIPPNNTSRAVTQRASPPAHYLSVYVLCALMYLHFLGSAAFAPKGNLIVLAIGQPVKRSRIG